MRALGEELIAAGLAFIDAPVSGGVKRANDGSLAIMAGGDAETIVLDELAPTPDVETDEAMLDYIRASGTTVYHPCGTCRMGSDAGAVVAHANPTAAATVAIPVTGGASGGPAKAPTATPPAAPTRSKK